MLKMNCGNFLLRCTGLPLAGLPDLRLARHFRLAGHLLHSYTFAGNASSAAGCCTQVTDFAAQSVNGYQGLTGANLQLTISKRQRFPSGGRRSGPVVRGDLGCVAANAHFR